MFAFPNRYGILSMQKTSSLGGWLVRSHRSCKENINQIFHQIMIVAIMLVSSKALTISSPLLSHNTVPYPFFGLVVVVINAQYIKFSGNKETRYQYRWHTGYPGGLKEMTPETLREHKPEEVEVLPFDFLLILTCLSLLCSDHTKGRPWNASKE
jgi:hypothetical protein